MFKKSELKKPKARVQLLGSGTILNEVIKAAEMLERDYGIAADVWSATSYKALYYDAIEAARHNRLNPGSKARLPYVAQCLNPTEGPIVAASDYMKVLPAMVSGFLNRPIHSLGTDGFGRSETREALRDFFEVDAKHVLITALSALRSRVRSAPVPLPKPSRSSALTPSGSIRTNAKSLGCWRDIREQTWLN